MQTPDQAAVREVPIHIFDLTEKVVPGLEAGFYYSLPVEDQSAIIDVEGPYDSRQDALDAAGLFIRDCLTNHATGDEE
jgi:hypothetical protein